ncbi:MAG TPA: deoxyribonuclease IV [Bacteroidota bacterium]
MPLLGTHVSVSGGLHTAFERAARAGCTTMQLFVKNASQWKAKPLTDEEIRAFRAAAAESPVRPVIAHAAYLINLCAVAPGVMEKSRAALEDELLRCEALGVRALVFHPGSHVGAGEEAGIRCIAESLNLVHERTRGLHVLTTLETTAGQGSTLGYRFEQLRAIIDQVEDRDRMAVCMDTCHMFTAGYPIHTAEGWEAAMKEFDQAVGLARLVAVHVNDSKKPFGSRLDRHEHIGKGLIGLEGFRSLMNDPRLEQVPKILETDKSEDMHEDVENMAALKSLVRSA